MNRPCELTSEFWFAMAVANRSSRHVFSGTTNTPVRRERCRLVIHRYKLATTRVLEEHPDTFADVFERVYHEPLGVPRETSALTAPPQQQLSLGGSP